MTTTAPFPRWTDQDPHQIALEALAQFQWSVFPLDEEKRPPRTGTTYPDGQPQRLGWKSLQTRHPSPKEIDDWQNKYRPAAWAVITGAISDIVLLDFDGEAGQQTRTHLGLLHPHVQTGSGGHHVYFQHPGWPVPTLNCKSTPELGKRWPGLDIRADGGYAAFCGKNTQGPYRWLRNPELDDLALLPQALRQALGLWEPPAPFAAGNATTTEALLARALHLVQEEGRGRNDMGFWLACQLRDNGYTLANTKEALRAYVERVPKKNTKGQVASYTLGEAFASVRSAFNRPAQAARTGAAPASADNGDNGTGAPPVTDTPAGPERLPEIFINNNDQQLITVVDQSVAAIMDRERQEPRLFMQSARLVYVGRNEQGRPLLTQMGMVEVKEVLTHCANFFRFKKVSGKDAVYEKSSVSPPKELAEHILARQTLLPYLPFPSLTAIVETPVMRPDGSILDQPGYDPATQLYYAPAEGMEACKVPLKPGVKVRKEALSLLLSAIGEFPYASAADRANALALLLTPLVRPAIKRHVPLALIDAPKQGTGKGLLSDVVAILATGSSAAILTMSENEEELQKLITALLIEGTTMITIDNITGRLQSRHLDAVLTSDMWRGRILGMSKTTLVPQRATWIATGNNIKVGGDLARRCYRIRLDARVSRPFLRKDFTHSDLVEWVSEQRAGLVRALLTLARAWYAAGEPSYDHLPMLGTFSGWVKIVGGILEHAGVQGFLSNLEQLYEQVDEDANQWEAFFSTWHQVIGEEWVPLSTLFAEINASNAQNGAEGGEENGSNNLYEMLPVPLQIALQEKPRSFAVRLAKALDRLVDTSFGAENLRLEKKRDSHNKTNLWRIFAGGAEGVSPPTQGKNFSPQNFSVHENLCREGGNNPPHPPQTAEMKNGSNGLETGASAISPSLNDRQNSEKSLPPSATPQEREEFTL